jgi:hypothetical protein
LASNLKNLSSQISKSLEFIIKHANEVMEREKEAYEAAKKMEEASLKATIARNNMVAVRIFFIFYFISYRLVKKRDLLQRIV